MTSPLYLSRRPGKKSLVTCYARYESEIAEAQYCDAHYGPDKFGVTNFPAHLAQLCAAALCEGSRCRALDLGCAVGRASFELATRFEHVTGLDFSSRFIAVARRLQEHSRINYRLREEGELISDHLVNLADLGLSATASKVSFYQGDAQRLEAPLCDFDLILAANLIDRLPDPGTLLAGIHRRLVLGGLLALASPYSWMEAFTPRQQWLGGRFHAGCPLPSLEGLGRKLARHFTAVGEPLEVEFVIRETARTYQHGISQLTFWRRVH